MEPTSIVQLHLPLFGQDHMASVALPQGTATWGQFLPALRQLTQTIGQATLQSLPEGQSVQCSAGCDACCRQLVRVSTIEAVALAKLVAAMPADRQAHVRSRFTDALTRLRAAGIVAPAIPRRKPTFNVDPGTMTEEEWKAFIRRYFEAGVACPFLEQGLCSIYQDRPLICREYLVTSSPRHCATLDTTRIAPAPLPLQMSISLTNIAASLDPPLARSIPLTFALAWVEAATIPEKAIDTAEFTSLLQLELYTT